MLQVSFFLCPICHLQATIAQCVCGCWTTGPVCRRSQPTGRNTTRPFTTWRSTRPSPSSPVLVQMHSPKSLSDTAPVNLVITCNPHEEMPSEIYLACCRVFKTWVALWELFNFDNSFFKSFQSSPTWKNGVTFINETLLNCQGFLIKWRTPFLQSWHDLDLKSLGFISILCLSSHFLLLDSYKRSWAKRDWREPPQTNIPSFHMHLHTFVLRPTGWVIAAGHQLPSLSLTGLTPQWLLVILIMLLFYNFSSPGGSAFR